MTNEELFYIIKAYKQGKQIQLLYGSDGWINVDFISIDNKSDVYYRVAPYETCTRPMTIKEIFEWWKHTHNPKVLTKDGIAGYTVLSIDLDNEENPITLSDNVLEGYENYTVDDFVFNFVKAEDNTPFTVEERGA